MIPWQEIGRGAPGTDDESLSLHRRGDEWSIRGRGFELMNSRRTGSERALATLAAEARPRSAIEASRVLVGGLGMGHTLRAALEAFPAARLCVAEISAKVIEWNRGPLASLAQSPLEDPRTTVLEEDVVSVLKAAGASGGQPFDAVLLDVDNGPEALSRPGNDALYSKPGLERIRHALAADGVLGVWSAGPSADFERRLGQSGWSVSSHRVAPRIGGRGRARHTVWIARMRRR